MWLIKDILFFLLYVGFSLALILPPCFWWERRWNTAQKALKKADPEAYQRQKYRAGYRFERVDLVIIFLGLVAAFVVLRRCMAWWSG